MSSNFLEYYEFLILSAFESSSNLIFEYFDT